MTDHAKDRLMMREYTLSPNPYRQSSIGITSTFRGSFAMLNKLAALFQPRPAADGDANAAIFHDHERTEGKDGISRVSPSLSQTTS
jgi:hypothetical protein